MEPGEDPFQFMMKIDRLAADLRRLSDRYVTELRKCVTTMAEISAVCQLEVRLLEINPIGLERTEIERVVGNQYNRLPRQQQSTTALSASKGTATADRGEKNRRPRNRFEGTYFNCGRERSPR